jgi:hypothetical protein
MKVTSVSSFVLISCVLVSLSSVACDESSPLNPTPIERAGPSLVTLAIGQTVAVPETSLSLRFTGVLNDSRCPATALCIQLGEAITAFEAVTGAGTSRLELRTSDAGRVASIGGHTIELRTLLPYPYGSAPIDLADYRATLQVDTR